MLEKRSRKIVFIAVLAVIIVAAPISFYGLSAKPVPITLNDGYTSYLWKGNFTCENRTFNCARGPYWLIPQHSITSISTSGFPNSSLYLDISGHGAISPLGPCFQFCIAAAGNLTSNIHPNDLVISESIKAYSNGSQVNTDKIRYADCAHFLMSPNIITLSNLSCLQKPTSDPFIAGTGSTSWAFAIQNDTSLTHSRIFHFGLFPLKTGFSNLSFRVVDNNFCFFPQTYNFTYYATFSASLTGLSQPVSAQVELIMQYVP